MHPFFNLHVQISIFLIFSLLVHSIFSNDIDTGTQLNNVDPNDAANKPDVKIERFTKTKEEIWMELTNNGKIDMASESDMGPQTSKMYSSCFYQPLVYFHTQRPQEDRYEDFIVKHRLTTKVNEVRTELIDQGKAILDDFKSMKRNTSLDYVDFFYQQCNAFQRLVDARLDYLWKMVKDIDQLPVIEKKSDAKSTIDAQGINLEGVKGVEETESSATENAGDNANQPVSSDEEKKDTAKLKDEAPVDEKQLVVEDNVDENHTKEVLKKTQAEQVDDLSAKIEEKIRLKRAAMDERFARFGLEFEPTDEENEETDSNEKDAASKSDTVNNSVTETDNNNEHSSVQDDENEKERKFMRWIQARLEIAKMRYENRFRKHEMRIMLNLNQDSKTENESEEKSKPPVLDVGWFEARVRAKKAELDEKYGKIIKNYNAAEENDNDAAASSESDNRNNVEVEENYDYVDQGDDNEEALVEIDYDDQLDVDGDDSVSEHTVKESKDEL